VTIKTEFQFMNAAKAPYYAVIVGAGTLDTEGGPIIYAKGQVLDSAEGTTSAVSFRRR
jgi:hypothetical protein